MSESTDRPASAWLLSSAAVVVAGFWAIAVIPATTLPMTDPDTFWHIRAGREFLAGAGIPSTDTWSIAGQGRPWVSQDWLSNVVMAWGFGAGTWGPSVLSVLYGVIGAAALWLLWNAIGVRSPGIGWLARSGWLLFGLVLAAPVLGVRVQVIDLFLAAVVVNVLWRYLRDRRRWHPRRPAGRRGRVGEPPRRLPTALPDRRRGRRRRGDRPMAHATARRRAAHVGRDRLAHRRARGCRHRAGAEPEWGRDLHLSLRHPRASTSSARSSASGSRRD